MYKKESGSEYKKITAGQDMEEPRLQLKPSDSKGILGIDSNAKL